MPFRLLQKALAVAALTLFAACAANTDGDADAENEASAEAPLERTATRLCSWNIRRLGHNFDSRPKDIEATASILRDHCDLVAVQEIMQTSDRATPGHAALMAALGAAWDGVITERPRPDTTSANSERYGFYFRKDAARLCTGWTDARYIPDDEGAFLREPAFACLKLASRKRELLVLDYHAIYGSAVERRREVTLLDDDLDFDGKADDVVRHVRSARKGNKADVVIVGDFNLTPNELAVALPRYADKTTGSGSTLNAGDNITGNLYDHVVLAADEPLTEALAPAEVLDVRSYARGDTFYRSVSDHLPIRVVLPSD